MLQAKKVAGLRLFTSFVRNDHRSQIACAVGRKILLVLLLSRNNMDHDSRHGLDYSIVANADLHGLGDVRATEKNK